MRVEDKTAIRLFETIEKQFATNDKFFVLVLAKIPEKLWLLNSSLKSQRI